MSGRILAFAYLAPDPSNLLTLYKYLPRIKGLVRRKLPTLTRESAPCRNGTLCRSQRIKAVILAKVSYFPTSSGNLVQIKLGFVVLLEILFSSKSGCVYCELSTEYTLVLRYSQCNKGKALSLLELQLLL